MAAAAPPRARPAPAGAPPAGAAFLNNYARANGNMSVQRRFSVLVPALARVGYTRSDAEDIVLDAPLSKDYTNERALYETLKYANSIQPGAAGQSPAAQALAQKQVPMPTQATKLYTDLRNQNTTLGGVRGGTGNFFGSVKKGLDAIGDRLSPIAGALGDQSTPGGLGTLFALNLLFLAAVVPANAQGYTRLELMWLTLMNRTKLDVEITPPESPNNALIVAAVGVAEGVQSAAQAVGNVAGAVGNLTGGVQNFFGNIPVIGGIIGAIGSVGTGPPVNDVAPPTNTGTNPPLTTARPPTPPRRVVNHGGTGYGTRRNGDGR